MNSAAQKLNCTYSFLVIEDDEEGCELLPATGIQAVGKDFSVHRANNVTEASTILDNQEVDAIIIDLNLCDNNRRDTLIHFQDTYRHIPLVVHNEIGDEQVALEAIQLGAQEYIVKGHSGPDFLINQVLRAIERKRIEQTAIQSANSTRDKAEDRLAEAENRFQSIVEQLPAITYILDASDEFKPVYISPQAMQILGYSEEEWFQDPLLRRKIVHEEDQDWVQKTSESCFATGQELDLIYRVVSKDNEIVWFKDHANAQRDQEGNITYIHGVMLDVSRRMHAEMALKKRDQQLQQSQKMHAVGRLAGGIAHEFNNLLTSILGFSYLLLDDVDADHPHHEYAGQIVQSGERASDLIRQMLAFSSKQTNKVENFNLNELVTNLHKILRKSIDPNVELVIKPGAGQATVKGDKNQLEQILMNLVGNAEDAMDNNGKIIISTEDAQISHEEAEIRKCKAGPYICLSVQDTGDGIDPKIIDKIYDPFFSTKEVGQGVGLGLSIVYTNVEQHQGHIDIQSKSGEGTDFKIYLPLVETDESVKTPETELPRGNETILLVEDEDSVRDVTVRTLESLGYYVLPAENGGEAILVTETYEKPIHLLLTDFAMPKLNGKKLVDRLRKDHDEFKVLYTSGYDRETVGSQNEEVYETNFIQKPFNKDALAFMVRQVLDESTLKGPSILDG